MIYRSDLLVGFWRGKRPTNTQTGLRDSLLDVPQPLPESTGLTGRVAGCDPFLAYETRGRYKALAYIRLPQAVARGRSLT
jgi:hypothetical protein